MISATDAVSFGMFSSGPYFSPDPPDSSGGSGPASKNPAPQPALPLVEVLDTIVREALRQHIQRLFKGIPECCLSDAALGHLWPLEETKKLVKDNGQSILLTLPNLNIVAGKKEPNTSLAATVLRAISKLTQPPTPSKAAEALETQTPSSAKAANFNFAPIKLDALAQSLEELEKKVGTDEFRLVYNLVGTGIPLEILGSLLQSENSSAQLIKVFGYRCYAMATESGTVKCAYGLSTKESNICLFLLNNTAPFKEFMGRLYPELLTADPSIRNVRLLESEELIQLTGGRPVGEIPNHVQALVVPIRYGEISYGCWVVAIVCDPPMSNIPLSKLKDLEWFANKAGEAYHLLPTRLEADNVAQMPSPQTRVISNETFTAKTISCTCRRVIIRDGENVGVVFVSDENSSGRSTINAMKTLATETLPIIADVPIEKIRWFDRRVGGLNGSGVQQSNCFDEALINFSTHADPTWRPARDAFSTRIADALSFSFAELDSASE